MTLSSANEQFLQMRKKVTQQQQQHQQHQQQQQPVMGRKRLCSYDLFLFCLLSFSLLIHSGSGFNVDVNSRVIHGAPKDSCDQECMFGFSVAQHRERGVPWLLVGAPAAESGQPGINKGGAVYKCAPDSPGRCDLIPFDTKGNTLAPTGQQYDKKSGQWFGALVKSSGDNGVVLACAPRYVYYIFMDRMDPVGMCFTARNNFTQIRPHRPCVESGKWGYHRQGSCQAGLGADIADDGNQIFVGAVGSWYWQGQVFSQKLVPLKDQSKTAEGSPSDDDSYLGYSVATGDFNGDGDSTDVAVGMPRGANLTGKVVLYNSNLTNLHNMTGDQIGAYFGYSVASGDLNGDGLDDVIIGAPMWTNYEVMGKYETGKVFIVYQNQNRHFRKYDALEGQNHKARFGLSVACAGNINLDGRSATNPKGIEDLVVGAPYDGPDGRGAIYIFLGSLDGISKKPSQVIMASDIDASISTFGWSLSAGMDLDQNEYPDLLIGAYESANAVYLRSAPVVHLDSKVNFRVASKQINLDDKTCKLSDGTRVPCVDVDVGLKYDGVGVPDTIELEIQYLLDAKKEKSSTKRLFFLKHEGLSALNRTVVVSKGRDWKDSFTVHLPASGIHDKLTSIDVQVRCSLATRGAAASAIGTGGRRSRSLVPVLGHDDRLASDSLSIQKNCGSDNVCIPNLSVNVPSLEAYVIGSGEKLEISAEIQNGGEDAFNAMLYLQIPRGVNYINANSSTGGVSVLCSPPSVVNNRTLQCDVGNPLPAKSQVTVRIFLQPTEQDQDQYLGEYLFYMAANSSNPESLADHQDNQLEIRIPVSVTSDWRVTGTSKPSQVEYNITAPKVDKYIVEDQIGEEIFHIYELKNRGPSTIQEAEVYILWPSFDESKKHLLYLLGVQSEPSDRVVCKSVANINPLYVKTIGSKGYAEALTQAESLGFNYERSDSSSRSSSSWSSSSSSSSSSSYSSSSGKSSSAASSGGSRQGSAEGGSSSVRGGSAISGSGSSSASGGGGGRYRTSYEYESTYKAGSGSAGAAGGARGVGGGASSVESETSSGSSQQGGATRYGSVARVAEGAEETRLIESDDGDEEEDVYGSRNSLYTGSSSSKTVTTSTSSGSGSSGSAYGGAGSAAAGSGSAVGGSGSSSYDYERKYEGSYSAGAGAGGAGRAGAGGAARSSSSSSSTSSSTYGSVAASGWKLLDNGTYIRIYDARTTAKTGGAAVSGSADSSSGSSRTTTGSRVVGGGDSSSSYDSGWELQPDGSYKRRQETYTSYSSGSGSRGVAGQQSGEIERGGYSSSTSSSSASETRLDGRNSGRGSSASGGRDSLNVILGAAQGPGDYHGTMSKAELEREAGGRIFTSGDSETRSQVETTRYQGSGGAGYQGSRTSGGSESYQGSRTASTGGSETYRGSGYSGGRSSSSQEYGSSSGGGYRGGSSSGRQGSTTVTQGYRVDGGRAVDDYDAETDDSYQGSYGRGQQSSSAGGAYGAGGGGSVHYEEGSYYDQSNRGRYTGSGSTDSSISSTSSTSSQGSTSGKCKYVWSDQNNRWECEGASDPIVVTDQGSTDSGWVTLPDGTRVRSHSAWSSWNSTTAVEGGGAARGGAGRRRIQGGKAGRRRGQGEESEDGTYFQSGHIAEGGVAGADDDAASGHHDSGWVDQGNGTYVRRKSSWSRSRSESSVGGVQLKPEDIDELSQHYAQGQVIHGGEDDLNAIDVDGHAREAGDHGRNSTGWTHLPDGTMIRKSSSWASWSATSTSDDNFDDSHLDHVRRRLEQKTNDLLHGDALHESVPSNVEPGFETSFRQRSPEQQQSMQLRKRTKRAVIDFEREINCPPSRCTMMMCTVGPLLKDESVVFKIRSRLFTQTQIENHAKNVEISSKLVARITRLPYLANPLTIEHQVHSVTTEVFPSEMGEAPIPWWVWLLAALGGLLLLALICYCLYKCGFFKRKRPDNSPERQPLNGYH